MLKSLTPRSAHKDAESKAEDSLASASTSTLGALLWVRLLLALHGPVNHSRSVFLFNLSHSLGAESTQISKLLS